MLTALAAARFRTIKSWEGTGIRHHVRRPVLRNFGTPGLLPLYSSLLT